MIDEAASHYDAAIRAQRVGDWSTYGSELKALGDTLQKLQAASQGE
jgi:uncharacterized membrane protein (UPF0182 family)